MHPHKVEYRSIDKEGDSLSLSFIRLLVDAAVHDHLIVRSGEGAKQAMSPSLFPSFVTSPLPTST